MIANYEDKLLKALIESSNEVKDSGVRSNKKLKPLHGAIAEMLENEIRITHKMAVKIQSLGYQEGKEASILGRYNKKNSDIVLSDYKGEVIYVISVKFPLSNYAQNSYNYFENLIGEAINIKRAGILFGHIFIIPKEIPYLKKSGSLKKIDKINEKDLQKYANLDLDKDSQARPDDISIILLESRLEDNGLNILGYSDPNRLPFNHSIKHLLHDSNISIFIKNVAAKFANKVKQ